MENTKHRVLICSGQKDFLHTFLADLNHDFEVQQGATQEICEFLVRDWKPHITLVDGDEFGNLTANLRQIAPLHAMGIIVLSQKEGLFKEEYAFRSGADHFLPLTESYKPLVWRMISLIRKHQAFQVAHPAVGVVGTTVHSGGGSLGLDKPVSSITYAGLKIFPQDFIVKTPEGKTLKVTPIQFKLLIAFITHVDKLLTREWIIENIWEGAEISPRSIDAQVSKMKKLLPLVGKDILNIYGQGYMLNSTEDSSAA